MRLSVFLVSLVMASVATIADAQVGTIYPCNSRNPTIWGSGGQSVSPDRPFGIAVASGFGSQTPASFLASGIEARVGPTQSGETTIHVVMTGTLVTGTSPHPDTCG